MIGMLGRRTSLIILLTTVLFSCTHIKQEQSSTSKLWYTQPAATWEEALPVGNGRIGAMIFGDPHVEHLQLNDDSMWPGNPEDWNQPDGRPEDLKKLRQLLMYGKNQDADSLFVDKFSNKGVGRSHQTLGDLFIEWNHNDISDYRRELDLNYAVATVSYKSEGYQVTEEILASHPDEAIIIHITSEVPEGLNGKISLSRPMDQGHPTAKTIASGNQIKMNGEVTQYSGAFQSKPYPITEGVKFETVLEVVNKDGVISSGDSSLMLKGVHEATFILVNNSDYYYDNYSAQNESELNAAKALSFSQLKESHINDYQELFTRSSLTIQHDQLDSLPTNQRLNRIKNGSQDVGLELLLFDYGKYLLIASSRPGTNPANLQGLWNPHISAPWNGDYHLNINLQMNYWPANLTNLDDLNQPLFDYIDLLVANGHETASVNFGCKGSFIPHATDLWGPTWLRAPTAYWGCSVGAGGWMMQHYWEHVLFTQDTTFLRERAFPVMHEVAQFYSDWIIEDPRDGYLVSAPSTSPENIFLMEGSRQAATVMGSAMDQQIIHELFTNYLSACEWLGVENDLRTSIQSQLPKLRPGFVLGSDGRILEWDREYEEHEPGHRHMSHLYGFHPGTEINKTKNPELLNAVRKTLDYRLANGGAGTGWSRAWLINVSARLGDGPMAYDNIQKLFSQSMYINLFDAHPPFQIDGNFGYTAGVCEMLLQSHAGYIELLPALPTNWSNGSFSGLKARGNVEVSVKWEANQLLKLELKGLSKGDFKVLKPQGVKNVKVPSGNTTIDSDFIHVSLTKGESVTLEMVY